MSKILTNNQYYYQIADVIREQNGTSNTYTPPQMVSALKDLFYEEVEGVPPITFQGIGENLLDYRIDGASGGVGDKTSNLLQNTASSQTINGVTFTVNNDGSIICNGTSSAITTFAISIKLNSNINYVLSGSPKNGGFETYRLDLRNISYLVYNNIADNGDGINFTVEENGTYLVCIRIVANYTCNNLTFYPMIRLASIQDDTYEPYGYKVPVVISGKNLFDETIEQGGFNTAGLNADSPSRVRNVEYTPVESSKTYTLSLNVDNNKNVKIGVSYYNTNDYTTPRISSSGWINNPNKKFTFTTPNNTAYIRFIVAYNNDSNIYPSDLSNIQIEEGNTATDYEPYHEPTTTNIYIDKPIEAKANIPSEYEEVEYIESTGTQYIDTGIKVNTTTSSYETKINPSSVSDASGIFGTRNNTTADVRSMNIFIINGAFRLDWLSGTALSEINISPNTEYTISITRGLATINNVDYTSEQTTSVNSLYTFYIGNFNNAGRPFSNGFSGKIYYSKLYNNNILVFDGVPCYRKSDNVAGLYDLVNSTFYTNNGTGNFIVGPIKENESISLSDTNTDIPTIRGTNVLSVDTTVQTSQVYVKSRHESSYEAAMRERYEEAQAQLDALESEEE